MFDLFDGDGGTAGRALTLVRQSEPRWQSPARISAPYAPTCAWNTSHSLYVRTMRAEFIGRFKTCMTDIYHIYIFQYVAI